MRIAKAQYHLTWFIFIPALVVSLLLLFYQATALQSWILYANYLAPSLCFILFLFPFDRKKNYAPLKQTVTDFKTTCTALLKIFMLQCAFIVSLVIGMLSARTLLPKPLTFLQMFEHASLFQGAYYLYGIFWSFAILFAVGFLYLGDRRMDHFSRAWLQCFYKIPFLKKEQQNIEFVCHYYLQQNAFIWAALTTSILLLSALFHLNEMMGGYFNYGITPKNLLIGAIIFVFLNSTFWIKTLRYCASRHAQIPLFFASITLLMLFILCISWLLNSFTAVIADASIKRLLYPSLGFTLNRQSILELFLWGEWISVTPIVGFVLAQLSRPLSIRALIVATLLFSWVISYIQTQIFSGSLFPLSNLSWVQNNFLNFFVFFISALGIYVVVWRGKVAQLFFPGRLTPVEDKARHQIYKTRGFLQSVIVIVLIGAILRIPAFLLILSSTLLPFFLILLMLSLGLTLCALKNEPL